MRLKHHLALVITACSIGGIGLALGLQGAYAELDADVSRLQLNSLAQEKVARLRDRVNQWLWSVDQVSQEREGFDWPLLHG